MAETLSLREQKIARTVDREIAPVWHDRFARMILRHLPTSLEGVVLDVHSGTGRSTEALLERLPPAARVIGLEPSAANRALAKSRIRPEWKQRVYLKPGDITDVAGMADDAYELVVANLVLSEAHDLSEALRGLLRVTKPGGTLLATLPMYESWFEAERLLRDVMQDAGMQSAPARLRRMASRRPTGAEVAAVVRDLGVSRDHFVLEQDRFSLLFRSGREFLFSALVEHGPLRLWKAVIAREGNPQEIFFKFKEAIDTYFSDHVFTVSVTAGLLHVHVPTVGRGHADAAAATAGEYWRRYPTLDALWQDAELNPSAYAVDEDIDIDVDEAAEPSGSVPAADDELQPPPGPLSDEDHAMLALLDKPVPEEQGSPELPT